MNPRSLVLVHGSEDSSKEMKRFISEKGTLIDNCIFTPSANEIIDLSSNIPMFSAKLKNNVNSMKPYNQSLESYTISYINTRVSKYYIY